MNEMYRIQQAAQAVRDALGEADIAVVLGSGLGDYADALNEARVMPYADIPYFPRSTVSGHAGKLYAGTLQGKKVFLLQGRFHSYEGHLLTDVTLPVRVLAMLKVHTLILTNAAGAVNTDYHPGELMLLSDFINLSGKNPLRGDNLDFFGPRFPDMSNAYDAELRALARNVAKQEGITLREGVYVWMNGPCYETPAEIRMTRILGGDAVGMSTVPETIVAAHCGMRVLGISCLTNMAAGILPQPLSHQEVMATGQKAGAAFRTLLNGVIRQIEL